MRTYVKTIATALAAAALAAAAPAAEGPTRPGPAEAPGKPVALVGSAAITEAQVDATIEGQLRELRMREFQVRSQALDELIAQKLIENEAAARGVAVPALLKAEVEDKAPMSDAEVSAFYLANKARFASMPPPPTRRFSRPGTRPASTSSSTCATSRRAPSPSPRRT